jgi:hypothetical protein
MNCENIRPCAAELFHWVKYLIANTGDSIGLLIGGGWLSSALSS